MRGSEESGYIVPSNGKRTSDIIMVSRQLCDPVAYASGDTPEPAEDPLCHRIDAFYLTVEKILEFACRNNLYGCDGNFYQKKAEGYPFIPRLNIITVFDLGIDCDGRQLLLSAEQHDHIIVVDKLFSKQEIKQYSNDWPKDKLTKKQQGIRERLSGRRGAKDDTHLAVVGCGNLGDGSYAYFSYCAYAGIDCEKTNFVVLSAETAEVLCPTATRDRLAVSPGAWKQKTVGELFVPGFR
jgi:hypothetical protein